MSEKNITLRNKFVKKINNNIVKLTKDIKLLTRVDESLYDLSGGGMVELKAAMDAREQMYVNRNAELMQQLDNYTDKLQININLLNKQIEDYTIVVSEHNLIDHNNDVAKKLQKLEEMKNKLQPPQ
jgi:hypothetical protein